MKPKASNVVIRSMNSPPFYRDTYFVNKRPVDDSKYEYINYEWECITCHKRFPHVRYMFVFDLKETIFTFNCRQCWNESWMSNEKVY